MAFLTYTRKSPSYYTPERHRFNLLHIHNGGAQMWQHSQLSAPSSSTCRQNGDLGAIAVLYGICMCSWSSDLHISFYIKMIKYIIALTLPSKKFFTYRHNKNMMVIIESLCFVYSVLHTLYNVIRPISESFK